MAENFEKIKKSIINLSVSKIEELLDKEQKVAEKKYLESKKLISSETRKSKRQLDSGFKSEKTKIQSRLEIELNKEKREFIEGLVSELMLDINEELKKIKKDKKIYKKILLELIKESIASLSSDSIQIYSSADDKSIFDKVFIKDLTAKLKIKINYAGIEEGITGGVIIRDAEKQDWYFDNSLDYRLEKILIEVRGRISKIIENQ
ncbi:hypothetical protein KAU33_07370 [Candidatus Dependentiae bacterium]|nr:hypothetical protein [Candidatus Dependentiae bacterium]